MPMQEFFGDESVADELNGAELSAEGYLGCGLKLMSAEQMRQ